MRGKCVGTHPNEGQISRRGRGRSPSGHSQPAGARTPSPARSPAARLRHWPAGAQRWPWRGSVPTPSLSLPGRGGWDREKNKEVKRQRRHQGRLAKYYGIKGEWQRETNRKSEWKTGKGETWEGRKEEKNTETGWKVWKRIAAALRGKKKNRVLCVFTGTFSHFNVETTT